MFVAKSNIKVALSLLAAMSLASCAPKGPAGPAGPAGKAGESGIQGLNGSAGLAGQGLKGDKGDKGERGETGARGEAGPRGETGATGATGAAGTTGATGATGSKGERGLPGEVVEREVPQSSPISAPSVLPESPAAPSASDASAVEGETISTAEPTAPAVVPVTDPAPAAAAAAATDPATGDGEEVAASEEDLQDPSAPPPVAPPPPSAEEVKLRQTTEPIRNAYIRRAEIVMTPEFQLIQSNVPRTENGRTVMINGRSLTRDAIKITPDQIMKGQADKRFAKMITASKTYVDRVPKPRDPATGRPIPDLVLPIIECTYVDPKPDEAMSGNTPKFKCALDEKYGDLAGKKIKVKYALNKDPQTNKELGGEVLATRLLWLMGFASDKVYPVQVSCTNCPTPARQTVGFLHKPTAASLAPGAPRSTAAKPLLLEYAVIERKVEGEGELNLPDGTEGWSWLELRDKNRPGNLAAVAEKDALRALITFIQHGDNKPPQQRLYCDEIGDAPNTAPGKIGDPAGAFCRKPFMLVQDVGATFGGAGSFTTSSAKMNLEGWAAQSFWTVHPGEDGVNKFFKSSLDGATKDPITGKLSFGTGKNVIEEDGKPYTRHKIACEANLTRSQTAVDGEGRQNALLNTLLGPITHKYNTEGQPQEFFMISEAGRAFLAKRLAALTDAQMLSLFYASRVWLYDKTPASQSTGNILGLNGQNEYMSVNNWLRAFKQKIKQVTHVECATDAEIRAFR